MKELLVIGNGHSKNYRVYSSIYYNEGKEVSSKQLHLDKTKEKGVKQLISKISPDIIIDTVDYADGDRCEENQICRFRGEL